jgi:hypothetical protein
VKRKLFDFLPTKLCPECGANVYSCVEADRLVDLQAPGRMPICWSCSALLVVDQKRNLCVPTAAEIKKLVDLGVIREIEAVQGAGRDMNEAAAAHPTREDPAPWVRSAQ